jgi:hypothetical protein
MDEASEDDLFELNVLSNLAEISSDVVDFPVPPAIINGNFLSPFKWDGYSYGLNKPGVNEDGSLTGYYICSKKKVKIVELLQFCIQIVFLMSEGAILVIEC